MKGIVTGGSQQTVDAGAEMLRRGGNAVDAAVAAIFAGFMAEAAITAPGGGGFALVDAPGQDPVVYDFFCAMPGLGRTKPLAEDIDFTCVSLDFEDSSDSFRVGRGATAVPGNPAGLAMLLAERGTLPLAVVLGPTIRLAREGYALSPAQAYLIKLVSSNILCYTPGSAAIFAPAGRLLRAGEHFSNPALAETLETLAVAGMESLYTGALANLLVADHAAHGGLITAQDLASYTVIKREPLRYTYRGRTLYTNPPPSMGGILIAFALQLLDRTDLGDLAHGGADHVALLAEVMRATAEARRSDRPSRLPDPAAWDAWLHGPAVEHAWARVRARLAGDAPRTGTGLPGGPSSTTHVSVIDESGLSVGITTTPGETGGYVVGDSGLLMNNILGESDLNPDGFHLWTPGERLYSMMAPTLVDTSDPALGHPERLIVGSGGSNRLRSAILQLLSNVLDWRLPLAEAAERARVHFENDVLDLEAGYDPGAADALAAGGYNVRRWRERSLYFGGTHGVLRRWNGALVGAGDSRRGGSVAMVE